MHRDRGGTGFVGAPAAGRNAAAIRQRAATKARPEKRIEPSEGRREYTPIDVPRGTSPGDNWKNSKEISRNGPEIRRFDSPPTRH
jgi:hypothetical protein